MLPLKFEKYLKYFAIQKILIACKIPNSLLFSSIAGSDEQSFHFAALRSSLGQTQRLPETHLDAKWHYPGTDRQ